MTEESNPHDPSNARSERCDLQLPADTDEARSILRHTIRYAEAALILLDLDEHDLDAWAREDRGALSDDALAAADLVDEMVETSYRDALGIIADEFGVLLKGAPPPREETGAGTPECHVLFSNEEYIEDFLADGTIPYSEAAWSGISDAELLVALRSGELSCVEYVDVDEPYNANRFITKRSLCRYLAKQLQGGQSQRDGRG